MAFAGHRTYVPVDAPSLSITYFTLTTNFAPGMLTIAAGESNFNHTLPNVLSGRFVSQTYFSRNDS